MVGELDHERFATREAASRELQQHGDAARPELEKALARPGVSLEYRQRLEQILGQLARPTGECLRDLRAIEVLERLGTPNARGLLRDLATGDPAARLTREAKLALDRLGKLPPGTR